MAVHSKIPGLHIEIHSQGEALQELPDTAYYPEDNETDITRCYIPATSGDYWKAVFRFGLDYDIEEYSLRILTEVDGKYMDSVIMNIKNIKNGYMKESKGNRTGGLRLSQFKIVKVVDDEEAEQQERNNEIGLIKVSVWRVISRRAGKSFTKERHDPASTFSEKALKKGGAVSHNTVYDPPQGGGTLRSPDLTYIDPKNKPLAVYCFKYRSVESLEKLGIVDRTPDPSPSPEPAAEPNPHEMEEDVLRIYIASLQEKLKARRDVKQEHDAHSRGLSIRPKREAPDDVDSDVEFVSERPRKRRHVSVESEVIFVGENLKNHAGGTDSNPIFVN